MSLTLVITTPVGLLNFENVESCLFTSQKGEMEVLPDHESMIVPVQPGLLSLTIRSELTYLFIQSGVMRILENKMHLTTIECVAAQNLAQEDLESAIQESRERLTRAVLLSEKDSIHNDLQVLQAKLEIIKRLKELS